MLNRDSSTTLSANLDAAPLEVARELMRAANQIDARHTAGEVAAHAASRAQRHVYAAATSWALVSIAESLDRIARREESP